MEKTFKQALEARNITDKDLYDYLLSKVKKGFNFCTLILYIYLAILGLIPIERANGYNFWVQLTLTIIGLSALELFRFMYIRFLFPSLLRNSIYIMDFVYDSSKKTPLHTFCCKIIISLLNKAQIHKTNEEALIS